MITFKDILFLPLLFLSVIMIAQSYDIQSSTVSEKFNSKNEIISRHIRSNGVQGEEVLNVDIIVDPNNAVKELIVNDKKVIPLMFREYKILTDYVIHYVDREVEAPVRQGNTVTKIISEHDQTSEKLTEDRKKELVAEIKQELLSDQLIPAMNAPFDLTLTGNDLFINAKKQSESVFQKYKALYSKYSDIALSKTTYFQILQTL